MGLLPVLLSAAGWLLDGIIIGAAIVAPYLNRER